MKKRFWACFLSLSLVLTMMPTMAFAADDEVNEPGGTVEVCVETEGCTLEAGHEGECVVVESEPEEPESVPCKVTEGCTLENGHEGECVVGESEPEEPESAPCKVTEGCTLEAGHEGKCVMEAVELTLSNSSGNSVDKDSGENMQSNTLSGICGADGNETNVTWSLTQNNEDAENPTYTLTISGTGAMADYAAANNVPWGTYKDNITIGNVEEGITHLGARTFVLTSQLESVVLPQSLTSIGESAFNQSALTTITLPDNLKVIGKNAFWHGNISGSLIIPESVETIDAGAFDQNKLTDVTLPTDLKVLGGGALKANPLTSMPEIPLAITSLSTTFQNCTDLTSIEIPSHVTELDRTFMGCTGLTDVTIPETVESYIGVFSGCTNLTNAVIESKADNIGGANDNNAWGVFGGCTSLETVVVPSHVKIIGIAAFRGCSKLKTTDFIERAVSIGKEAFQGCESLQGSLNLQAQEIGVRAFDGCSALGPNINIANANEIGAEAFRNCTSLSGIVYAQRVSGGANLIANRSVTALLKDGILTENTAVDSEKLATPVKNGAIFEGWYDNENYTGEPVTNTETGKTYYARWDDSDYTVSEKLNFGEVVYGSTASQVIEVSGSDVAGALTVAENDIFETVVNEDNTITVTPHSNLSVGEYEETLYVTTPDGATFFVPVTLKVVRAGSELEIWANGAKKLSLSGGGNVTLTITGDLDADEVKVTCDNENIEVTKNADDTYTVTLPNETADYTFTATYDGDQNHEMARATCTVSVTRHTGGGGASHPEASDDSSSDRNDRDDDDTENIDEEDVPLTEGKVADFDDVPADAWFAEAVQYVYEHDLMTGVSENLFAPNAQMNRAMVAQILFNVEKPADTEAPAAFRDVAPDAWYAEAVNWAVWQGYMSGYGAGSFGPNDALTREQLVTVLWRYSGSPVMGDSSMLNTFSDAAMTSDYAQQAMTWAYAQGVISGNADGTLNPQGTATRAEVATILMRFYENMAE